MYRVTLTPTTASLHEVRHSLREHAASRPSIEIEASDDRVVVILAGAHVAGLLDTVSGVAVTLEPIAVPPGSFES